MKSACLRQAARLIAAAALPVVAAASSPDAAPAQGAPGAAATPPAAMPSSRAHAPRRLPGVAGLPDRGAPAASGPSPAAPQTAALAPAAVATDPMELLRQRLTERLAGSRTPNADGSHDLRVVGKAAPAPERRAAAGSAHGAPRSAGPHGAAHWSYEGPAGPQTWGGLRPDFALCGKGERQSPIDIRGGLAVDLEPVRFDYQASRFAVVDNGHTVQANLAPGNAIELGGRRFELQQLHFHRPSEERIDGRQFEMSVHLVHKDAQGKLAVVALLLDPGPAQPVVQTVWNNLPLERNQENTARVPLELNALLPADRRYYTYMGSLTTPPCSEGVQWVVMRSPVTVSPEQIELFARIYPMNARPVQHSSGRRILQSN